MPVATFFVTTAVTAVVSTVYAVYTARHRRPSKFANRINDYVDAK